MLDNLEHMMLRVGRKLLYHGNIFIFLQGFDDFMVLMNEITIHLSLIFQKFDECREFGCSLVDLGFIRSNTFADKICKSIIGLFSNNLPSCLIEGIYFNLAHTTNVLQDELRCIKIHIGLLEGPVDCDFREAFPNDGFAFVFCTCCEEESCNAVQRLLCQLVVLVFRNEVRPPSQAAQPFENLVRCTHSSKG